MKTKITLTIIAALSLFCWFVFADRDNDDGKEDSMRGKNGLFAIIHTTKGDIKLSLEFEKTPLTTTNFVGLAEGKIRNTAKELGEPFYNGGVFHRVIENFMIQGGDPTGTGRGGPGYNFPDEIHPELRHSGAGILSMANAGPGTNGSQFFITHTATPHLDGRHTVFGHVVDGQSVVNAIRQGDRIDSITIKRVGKKAKAFVADQEQFDSLLNAHGENQKRAQGEANRRMEEEVRSRFPNLVEAKGGFFYILEREGEGDTPPRGTRISAHYTGKFLDGTVFDSSVRRNQVFRFTVGAGEVIEGWDLAFLSMRRGEKRTIVLPPDLAYGSRGAGGVIPPNAWLIFEVELVDF
jgi:peptidylprolyl isomerase